ncbi:MAG: TonB-dependent receptor [Thermodesulfovibrionales bacterium]|nr:TonB-dependent receptor [Thermodesulfovibrionales bacterium]
MFETYCSNGVDNIVDSKAPRGLKKKPEDFKSHMKQKKGGIGMKVLLVFLFCLVVALNSAYASEEVKAKEVVITATKTEVEVEDVPASVEIITKKDIEAKGALRLSEILDIATGIYQYGYMAREKSQVSIRGLKPSQTLILIDGKRLSGELTSAYEIDRITMDNVERIEIVRGPVSSLYGSDALGGVINIITKTPEKFSLKINPQYGIYSGKKGENKSINATIDSGKIGDWGFILSGSILKRNPIYTPDKSTIQGDAEHKSLSLRVTYDLTKNTRLSLDTSYLKEDSEERTVSRNIVFRDMDSNNRYNASLGLFHKSPDLEYLIRGYISVYDKDYENRRAENNSLANFAEAKRTIPVFEARISKELLKNHLFTLGAEYRQESFKGTRIKTGSGTYRVTREGINQDGSKAKIDYWAMYLQDEWQVTDKLLVIPAIRYDDSNKFESDISPKIGVTYKFLPNLRLKLNYGHGFKSPTVNDLYIEWRHAPVRYLISGNPNLRSESSNSYEGAIEAEHGIFTGRIAYFINDVKDLIDSQQVTCPTGTPAGWTCYTYTNRSKAKINGAEIEGGFKVTDDLSLRLSYSYLDAKDKVTGERLTHRFKNKLIAKASYDSKALGLRINGCADYVGGLLLQQANPKIQKDYTIVSVNLAKDLMKNLELYAGIDNLFNKKDNDIPIVGAFYYGGFRMKF